MQRRAVLAGLLGVVGGVSGVDAGKKASKRKKQGRRRVAWCEAHPEKAVGCDNLPSTTCRGYVAFALDVCCEKARRGWGAFDRCLNR